MTLPHVYDSHDVHDRMSGMREAVKGGDVEVAARRLVSYLRRDNRERPVSLYEEKRIHRVEYRDLPDPDITFYLCCACGGVARASEFEALKRDEDDRLAPCDPGDYDPILRCPFCRWEHTDDDANPGLFGGWLRAVEAERDRLAHDPVWAERHREARLDEVGPEAIDPRNQAEAEATDGS